MEDPSSHLYARFSHECRLALLADPNNASLVNHLFGDVSDDDPLGHPETTVRINDDWTVSPSVPLHINDDEIEDNLSDEDETEVINDDSNLLESSPLNDVIISSQEEFTSDEEDQIVPASPSKICRLTTDHEEELSFSTVIELESESYEEEEDDEEAEEEEQQEQSGNGETEEAVKKNEEEVVLVNTESRKKSNVQDEETVNRSNPQPP